MAKSRFQRGSGVYTCNVCGKRTRDTGGEADSRLCAECFDRSSYENDHLDGNHADGSKLDQGCPLCAGHATLEDAVRAEKDAGR